MVEKTKTLHVIDRLLTLLFAPIKANTLFFVTMYLLGVVGEWLTLPNIKGIHLYGNLYLELFIDIYVVCALLMLLPGKVRMWVRRLIYIIVYSVAIVDIYCFWKFRSTITPTMLLLVDETDSREAGEFLRSYLSPEVVFSPVGWVFLLIGVHALAVWKRHWLKQRLLPVAEKYAPVLGGLVVVAGVWATVSSWHNKTALAKLLTARTIGEVEHTLTDPQHAVLYTPLWRLTFSVYANSLAAQQISRLVQNVDKIQVDTCSFRSPTIVLIIGESYGKHHSQQYGYELPTTPRQSARERRGRLVKFTDVVSPWNLTSFVFKNTFSLHVIGQPGEWCPKPRRQSTTSAAASS